MLDGWTVGGGGTENEHQDDDGGANLIGLKLTYYEGDDARCYLRLAA